MERNSCLSDEELMAVYNQPHYDTLEKRHKDNCEGCYVKFRNLVNSILSPAMRKSEGPETSID